MIQFNLIRKYFTEESTIGELFTDGQFICFVLEDKDRMLDSSWSIEMIVKEKIYGKTAIPSGKYKIEWTYSTRFEKQMPIILNVKAYDGIRIHPGNTEKDTLGCLIPGMKMGTNTVMESKVACDKLYNIIYTNINEKKDVFIEITRKT